MELPSENNKDKGRRGPPPPKKKEGRNQDRTAAFQPEPEQMPKEETQARNNRRRGRDNRPR